MAEKNNNAPSWPGMYNFQSIMEQFYNYKPGEDDELGNAVKNSFASNMIQSAFDKDMSKEMGEFQNALGQSNMQLAANLELQNNSAMMQQEFNYGLQSMGAQFEYQNEFANAQHDRDLGIIGATGEQERLGIKEKGDQDRLTTITTGEQQRLTDTNKIKETGEVSKLKSLAKLEDLLLIGNPMYDNEFDEGVSARSIIIKELTQINKLDDVYVTPIERESV